METIEITHVLPCSEETFWHLALDEAFTRTLYLDALGYQDWEQVSFEDTTDQIRRITRLTPPALDLPGALKKLARKGITYDQVEVFDRATRRLQTEIVPREFRGRIIIRSTTRAEPIDAGTCERVCAGTVEARTFPVSGLVERHIAANMQRAYERSAEHLAAEVHKRGAGSAEDG